MACRRTIRLRGGRLWAISSAWTTRSLLSLPLTGDVTADDPSCTATRAWILSPANPFHYEGWAASGMGSPHSSERYIRHIALAVQGGLTEYTVTRDPSRTAAQNVTGVRCPGAGLIFVATLVIAPLGRLMPRPRTGTP